MIDRHRDPLTPSKLAGRFAIMASLLVLGLMGVLTHRYVRPYPVDQGRIEFRKRTLAELKAAHTNLLSTYAWEDSRKGLVRVPITRAMELVEREWRNPAEARSNLIARAERAAALPNSPPRPVTSDPPEPRP